MRWQPYKGKIGTGEGKKGAPVSRKHICQLRGVEGIASTYSNNAFLRVHQVNSDQRHREGHWNQGLCSNNGRILNPAASDRWRNWRGPCKTYASKILQREFLRHAVADLSNVQTSSYLIWVGWVTVTSFQASSSLSSVLTAQAAIALPPIALPSTLWPA